MPDRPAAFAIAVTQIVQQRVHAGVAHVGILIEIPSRIEISVRPAALAPAEAVEVQQRLQVGLPNVGILRQIPGRIEQARCVQLLEFGRVVAGFAHGALSWRQR